MFAVEEEEGCDGEGHHLVWFDGQDLLVDVEQSAVRAVE